MRSWSIFKLTLLSFVGWLIQEVSSSGAFDCDLIQQHSSETKAFLEIKKAFSEDQDFDIKCLEYTCQKHFFNVAEFLIERYYAKKDIDTLEVIDHQLALLKRKQSKLYKDLAREDRDVYVIKPALKWAQSLDNVFIETKFSHRIDSPACVDIFDQKIKITEKHVNLTAKCRRGDDTLQYHLHLNLFDNIDTKASTWEKQSMGRIYLHLKKKTKPNRWSKLYLNDDSDKPGRVMLWKEVHDKYEKSLTDYAKQFREEEDDYDDFDHFVAREEGRHLETKMKMGKTETIQTTDVTDQIQAIDVTEEMRAQFESQAFRDQLLSGNYGGNQEYYEEEEEEYDEEDFDHALRDQPTDEECQDQDSEFEKEDL